MSAGRGATPRSVTRTVLWARAAGRCQYGNCNADLIGDLISGNDVGRYGLVAHIVASDPSGPRGEPDRSHRLSDDVANLMLLCHTHHRLVDDEDPAGHPEARLLAMKQAHELRVRTVTGIDASRSTHLVCYDATIGSNEALFSMEQVRAAVLPNRYPAEPRPIALHVLGAAAHDNDDGFFESRVVSLRRSFAAQVSPRLECREVQHLSVFALGPQPLLIEFGRLLCDIVPAEVFQPHREPQGWRWQEDGPGIDYALTRPASNQGRPALVVGISATVADERITAVMGQDVAIWRLDAGEPGNDIMRRRQDLSEFRRLSRVLLNDIKSAHGEHAEISVFPAMPASAAVELGRVWMPKADLPLVLFDQDRVSGGFVQRHAIRQL